jgi:Uma2 family endonuclease
MSISPSLPQTQPLLLDVSHTTLHITAEQFDRLCVDNPDLRLEMTQDGELIVMPPTGGETGEKNLDLGSQVWFWNRQTNLGKVFDSSTGYDFTAIGGGKVSPDVSWIELSRLEGIDTTKFLTVVPDFVIELRSSSDSLSALQQKMQDYRQLGVKLGLLINPKKQQIEIYQPLAEVELIESPVAIDCSVIMPDFILDLSRIW